MLEGAMIYVAVVFRHEPTIRRAMAFQSIPSIGHRIKATIGEKAVVAVVEGVQHDVDKNNSMDTCPTTIYCVEIAEATDVQNS